MRIAWWLVLVLCARSVAAAAPEMPQPRQFGVLEGLPSNHVNAIAEDRQGYLWIATHDGLARYDGVGFRVWRVGDGLRDNFIWTVHVDAQDRVWIGTRKAGLAVLDPERRRFRHYDRRTHPEIGIDDVWSVASTREGDVWFGTSEGGLHRLLRDGRILRYMPRLGDPRSLPSASVSTLLVDRRGTLWVGTRAGVARWTGRDFERLPEAALPAAPVNGLVSDRAGGLWIGMPTGGAVRRADGRIEPMPWLDPVNQVPALHMLLEDAQGAHWLDTPGGLARETRGRVIDVPLYGGASHGQLRPSWSSAYEDREGGLWFGSADAGLWHLPANWRNFTVLQRRVDDPASLANAYVYGIAPAADGGLWVVGSGGVLDWIEPDTGAIEHRLARVCGNFVNHGVIESQGAIWVGCTGQLVRFDPRSGDIRRWMDSDADDPAPPGDIVHFLPVAEGGLWIGTRRGLQLRDREGAVLDTVTPGDGRGLGRDEILEQLARAPDGGAWLATTAGMRMWNDGRRRFEPVPGAPAVSVYGFAPAERNLVWLAGQGTLSAFRWNGARLQALQRIGARDGMPAVAPSGIAVDGLGGVWTTTLRGLVHHDPRRGRTRVYGVRDGLPSQEFNDHPIGVSPLGYLVAGTSDGLLVFHPRQVQWTPRTPTLAIESVSLRRGDAKLELPRAGTLELRHDDRDLRVVARLLSFTDVHAHRYRFRLAGYDADWVGAGADGERLFARLAPGRYRLSVQARTADDAWTPSRYIDLRVRPPWWRTGWALAAFVLAAAAALAWIARAYRARLKRRHRLQLALHKRELAEQASEAKTRFLATLGHEVRTPMTGVLGMSELLLGTRLDPRQHGHVQSIRRAGEHLLRLVDDALDLARIEAGKLDLDERPFELRALIDEVASLMAPVAEKRGLSFADAVHPDLPRAVCGDRTRLAQILLNLLGNAIKFTERGSVAVEALPLAPGGVRFAVSDTGPGLNAEQRERVFRRFEQADGARTAARYGGSGLGLAISQELAAAMGGRIDVESVPGQGTRFLVDLPLAEAQDMQDPQAPPPARAPATDRALDILLVEDDPTVAEVLAGLLRAQGHAVTHVAHGLAALVETATRRFDIGLLDLDLPGLDGLALARQLRAQGFPAPLLAVTARADAEAEPSALAAGFDGFLRKPLTGDMLAAAVAAARRAERPEPP